MTKHLKITRPGSVLSVLVDQDITDAQASNIVALLKSDVTYGEMLQFLAERLPSSSWTETVYRNKEDVPA